MSNPLPTVASQREASHHDNIAVTLLRDMLKRNLALAGRMIEIGDCRSAKRLLESAITQCDQIASYRQGNERQGNETQPTIEV